MTPIEGYSWKADRVERTLQAVVILEVALAGLLVDHGSHRLALSPILLAAGLLSFWLTDIAQWVRLSRVLVAMITLAAVFPLSQQFLGRDTYEQLLKVSWLITFWLCVIFFQAKSPRVYGSLIVLSLLLVVIAAILSSSLLFAVLLVCYQFLGMLSLMLLYAYSGRLGQYETFWQRKKEAARLAFLGIERHPGNGRPIAYQEPQSLLDRGRHWPQGLLAHVAGLTVGTIVFAAGFFYLVPRVTSGGWKIEHEVRGSKVGFTSEISYEEMQRVLESNEIAFRVSATDAHTGTPYRFFRHVYYHGQTLTHYLTDNAGRAVWRSYGRTLGRPLFPLPQGLPGDRIRFDFLREPGGDNTLFYVAIPFAGEGTPDGLRFDRFSSRVFHPDFGEGLGRAQFRYTLYSTGFRDRSQLPLIPVINFDPRARKLVYTLSPEEKQALLELDRSRFPVLIKTAQEILRGTTAADSVLYRAQLLQNHFQDATRYTYTLNFEEVARRRKPSLDPLEDFVANHRMGHCEYFAGALVLMLRSVGIPARLVVGYVGGEFNPLGNYYQVYQRNAHAWVEAYLEPEEVPQGFMGQAIPPGGAAWFRLDPTPPDVLSPDEAPLSLTWFDKALDYAQLLWSSYVVELDDKKSATQKDATRSTRFPFAHHLVHEMQRLFWEIPKGFLEDWRREGWTNWRGGVVAAAVTFLLWLFWQTMRWVTSCGHLLITWLRKKRSPQRAGTAFYRRVEETLRRYGFRRAEAETQREFIRRVAQSFSASSQGNGSLAAALLEVVELFYAARFGGVEPNVESRRRIAHLLSDIREQLPPRGFLRGTASGPNSAQASRQSRPSGN